MIVKKILFVGLIVFLTISCKSEQEKALDSLKDSITLSALREFETTYPEMEPSVKNSFDELLVHAIEDSTLFSTIEKTESITDRFALEEEYLQSFNNGEHYDDVLKKHEANKEKVERIQKRIDVITEGLSKYKFRVSGSSSFTVGTLNGRTRSMSYDALNNLTYNKVTFSAPDSNRKGTFSLKYLVYRSGNGYVKITAEGNYIIDNDGNISATYNSKIYDLWFTEDKAWECTKVMFSRKGKKARVSLSTLYESEIAEATGGERAAAAKASLAEYPSSLYEMCIELYGETSVSSKTLWILPID